MNRRGHALDAETYKAVQRALQCVDATDPCPLCDSWPQHDASCVMATPLLDDLIGRGFAANPRPEVET